MSTAGKRAEIAAALSTVAGVNGWARRPKATASGDAWPRYAGSAMDEDSYQFIHTWQVLIQLPSDEAAAESWSDDHLDGLWAALQPVGYPVGVEPVDIGNAERPRIPALMITMRSE